MTVARVFVVVEGKTEETFVNSIMQPAMMTNDIWLTAIPLDGNVKYARYKSFVVNLLKSDSTSFCTTFVDYYGLGKGFPQKDEIGNLLPTADKKRMLEEAIRADVANTLGMRFDERRFIPYVQMHEFEGLLFADPTVLAFALDNENMGEALKEIRNAFATPEDINETRATSPSHRIKALAPNYQKAWQGSYAAAELSFDLIRRECPLFDAWIVRLEQLSTLA